MHLMFILTRIITIDSEVLLHHGLESYMQMLQLDAKTCDDKPD